MKNVNYSSKCAAKLFAIVMAISSTAWAEFPGPDYQCHTIQHEGYQQKLNIYLDYPSRTGSMMVQHVWQDRATTYSHRYHGYLKSQDGISYRKSEFALVPYHLNHSLTIVTMPFTSACGRGSCRGGNELEQKVSAQLLLGTTKMNFVCKSKTLIL